MNEPAAPTPCRADSSVDAVPFSEVLRCELAEIDASRKRRKLSCAPETPYDLQGARARHLIGLAFSGGGIRSATFNLGVLQGFARAGVLPFIDYLSSVSGGGYISNWLEAWITHLGEQNSEQGIHEVQAQLAAQPVDGKSYQEPPPVGFLRDYSNYLTPRMGLFGADTWAAIAIYLRNTLLNLLILIAGLGSLLLLPVGIGRVLAGDWAQQAFKQNCPILVLGIMSAVAIGFMAVNLSRLNGRSSLPDTYFTREGWIQVLVVLPLFFAALLLCGLLSWNTAAGRFSLVTWVWIGVGFYFLLWIVARVIPGDDKPRDPDEGEVFDLRWQNYIFLVSAAGAGALGGVLLWLLARILAGWECNQGREWLLATFGPPLAVLVFLGVGTTHLALIGRAFPDHVREWWGRLGGWMLIYSVLWTTLFGISIYAPLGVALLAGYVKLKSGAILAWIVSTAGGLLAGNSEKTSGKPGGKSALDWVATAAPYVFIVGLLAMLSVGIHAALPRLDKALGIAVAQSRQQEKSDQGQAASKQKTDSSANDVNLQSAARSADSTVLLNLSLQIQQNGSDEERRLAAHLEHWRQLRDQDPTVCFGSCAVLLGLSLFLSWRVDINEFSMHMFYRNRLVRCYLGASRSGIRNPNPFTGFDPKDDLKLKGLRAEKHEGDPSEPGYIGPFPIVNTALNITHGERLAWQERKAESFVFTPIYSGYAYAEMKPSKGKVLRDAYRPTRKYAYPDGGVYVGTAMGISGAAASPNMGYHTSPPLAFLMTVFNVRLGWWMGNPRHTDTWNKGGPRLGLAYLLAELFALTTDHSRYVYLSDGGHFENLGIYELVRRRCQLIIACDADADPDYSMGDLGNAIRKCRSDFGIRITINTKDIKPPRDCSKPCEPLRSTSHYAFGEIHYEDADHGAVPGTLIYIKTSVKTDDPADVLSYAAAHPDFPQQTTAEQWFDESQFESYRALGYECATNLTDASKLGSEHKKNAHAEFAHLKSNEAAIHLFLRALDKPATS